MNDEQKVPVQKFAYCTLCDKVMSYWVLPDGTSTFDRGEFLGHRDYLSTGFVTEQEAEEALIANRLRSAEKIALRKLSDIGEANNAPPP